MKYLTGFVLALSIALAVTSGLAQSTLPNGQIILLNVSTPDKCAWPSGATVSNGMSLCATSLGVYYAVNGGAFSPVAPPQTAPSVSFSQITGSLSATQLPSTMTCTTSTNITATAQKETLSSCQ